MADTTSITRSTQMEAFAKRVGAEFNSVKSSLAEHSTNIIENTSRIASLESTVSTNASGVGDTTVDLVAKFEAALADS